jgi:hypothetical protein
MCTTERAILHIIDLNIVIDDFVLRNVRQSILSRFCIIFLLYILDVDLKKYIYYRILLNGA